MSASTQIQWCDSTFNPWIGCTKVGPGCDNCYAERDWDLRRHRVQWGAGQARSRTSAEYWRQPMQWNREPWFVCDCGCGFRGRVRPLPGFEHIPHSRIPTRRRVFCSSLADVFDTEVPIEWFVDLLDVIRVTLNLDWLLLTKRIGNVTKRLVEAFRFLLSKANDACVALARWIEDWIDGAPPENVWLGATVVNQKEADRDIPKLLATPAAVRFLSIEPMLGPIDISAHLGDDFSGDFLNGPCTVDRGIDWVIAGGESGPHARPSHPDWFRSLRDQCATAGVPFLFKQWGEWLPVNQQSEAQLNSLYRSNRIADECQDQGVVDESYGRTCRVASMAVQIGGGSVDSLEPGAWGLGAMLTFKVGKKVAGRVLDGAEHNGFPRP